MKTFTLNGETKTITGWAKHVGISRQAMSLRLKTIRNKEDLVTALSREKAPGKAISAVTKRGKKNAIG